MKSRSEQDDWASIKTLMLPITAAAISGIVFSFSPENAVLLDLLVLVICAIWALSTLCTLIGAAVRLQWRRSIRLIVILLVSMPLCILAHGAGDYVHLAVMWPSYRTKIQASEGRRVDFLWGYYGTVLSSTHRILVYESDRTQPVPDSWRRLVGNFYIYEEYF